MLLRKLFITAIWVCLDLGSVHQMQRNHVMAMADDEINFPPMIDSDDIAFFFESNDIDSLHWALSNIFARSERNPNPDEVKQKLPEQLIARGGGLTYTTAYKLKHDLEQAQYLADSLSSSDSETSKFFGQIVAPMYQQMIDRIPPVEKLQRTHGLYGFRPDDYQLGLAEIYNKALHQTTFSELLDDTGKPIPLLNPNLDIDLISKTYLEQGVVVIDNLLTPDALERIRQLMLESTVWFQTKSLNFGGYVGAYIDDGLHDRILLQLAFELYHKFPKFMKGHFLRYLWAYKYDSSHASGINLHADQAAVNVNIWLTPDEAKLDHTSGGLVVFTAKPPADWDFEKFNTDTDFVYEQLLKPTGYANVTIPHKQNRAVIFDSALFHHTDKFQFKEGYKNRRINLTLLYGEMQRPSSSPTSKTEL